MAQGRPVARVLPEAGAVAREGAAELERAVDLAVRARGRAAIALSGGATPRQLLLLLAEPREPFRWRIPWSAVHVFWGDERHVPPDHPRSNYRLAREAFLDARLVPADNVHRIPAEIPDAQRAAHRYQHDVAEFFEVEPHARRPPRFDLVFLGLGVDGHTASLFPGSSALDEPERWFVDARFEPPRGDRITITVPVLAAARHVVFVVTGREKAGTVREVLEGPMRPSELPAQAVQPVDGDCLWLLDEAAASELAVRD
jgi:6-phosphogluconolactonase